MSDTNHRPTPDALDRATHALRDAPVPPGPPADALAATVAAVHNRLAGAVPAEAARQQRRRRIMRYVRFGSAATVAAGLLVAAGVLWVGGNRAEASFLRAITNAEKAHAVTVTMTLENGGKVTHVRKLYRRGDAVRADTLRDAEGMNVSIVGDLRTRTALVLDHAAKTAHRQPIRQQEAETLLGVLGSFAELKKQLAGGNEAAVQARGREDVRGRATDVYTVSATRPVGEWRAWVDPKTELPVRLRQELKGGALTLEFDNWNAELDDALFRSEPPAGYRLVAAAPGGEVERPVFIIFRTAVEKAEAARSMRAVAVTEAAPGTTFEMKMYVQGDAARSEMDMGQDMGSFVVIVDGKQRQVLQLFPRTKTAVRTPLAGVEKKTEAVAKDVGKLTGLLTGLKGAKVAALPDETVDGRQLKVFTIKGHKLEELKGTADVTVWIDPRTELPHRYRMEMQIGDVKTTSTTTFLGFNEDLDPKLFDATIPEGYTVTEAKAGPMPPAEKE